MLLNKLIKNLKNHSNYGVNFVAVESRVLHWKFWSPFFLRFGNDLTAINILFFRNDSFDIYTMMRD